MTTDATRWIWWIILPGIALPAAPALADGHVTPVSFSWSVQADTIAHAAGVVCPTGCELVTRCPFGSWEPSFGAGCSSQDGSCLVNMSALSLYAQYSCDTWCGSPCQCAAGGSGSASANPSISVSTSANQIRWIFGATLGSNASASASCGGADVTADGTATTQQHWELTFQVNQCVRLTFGRTHILGRNGDTSGGMSATSTITLTGPGGTLFTQTLAPPPPGGYSNGSGSLELILNPGVYTVTLDSQIAASVSAPVGGSPGGQAVGNCDLTFTPHNSAPSLSSQPAAASTCAGGAASFAVAAGGPGPFLYQWRKAGLDLTDGPTGTGSTIAGATTELLTITNVSAADAGLYDCSVSNGNDCPSTTSNAATLTVFAGGTGDGNFSATTDGADIQGMVDARLSGGPPSVVYCAYDMNGDNRVDELDVEAFVAALLGP